MSTEESASGSYFGVTEQELELARSAKEAFDNHRYENCLSVLKKLVELRREDARVTHNKAVAQYLLSNLTKTDEFRRTLESVEAQFEHDAKGGGSESVSPISVTEKGVLLFNKALIHQRLHQNSKARVILEQLFSVFEALPKHLGVQVCLLLTEVYVSTYELSRASDNIEILERRLFGGSLNNGGGRGDKEGDGRGSNDMDKHKAQLYQFRARLNLLHKNIKQCKKEVKSLTAITGPTACGQFLKANVEFLRGNYMKAFKVLSSAPKNPIVTDAGECLSSFLFNDIGCIHFELGKYNLSAHYFKKAIEENDAALNGYPPLDRSTPLSGRPLSMLGVNCRHVLLYNLGLQQLYGGHPWGAFESLLEVVQVFHGNPRLWLRLAEACIAAHAKSQEEQVHQMRNKSSTVQVVLGSGPHRKLIITPMQWPAKKSPDIQSNSAAMPGPTLEFASICLQNALFLLPSLPQSNGDEPEDERILPTVNALPGPPIKGQSILDLKSCILSCKAYVSLGLGDPIVALGAAKQLLDTPRLPGGLRYVAKLYLAESYIQMGSIQEALQHLTPDIVTDLEISRVPLVNPEVERVEPPAPRPTSSGVTGFPGSISDAKATLLLNLSSVYCMQKDYELAKKALYQAISILGPVKLPRQAILLSAYVEIMTGNMSKAIQVIKTHRPLVPTRSL
ncbi:PREDICTED: CCR4-NOT transcription complex subunit 10-like [Amphimedon queenslandica]|uniref:CCR4-NOT transcription complex subunit 10 n=1 Tax=Amphimedon queenslandica TaxID=400682 RepID=A0A1X7VW14_AMPQE|nr:PREDICTED: CCR4-NOT transcription complex subunit 10-like [Amphimedon queenslandica]|eukprot:XP_003382418.1 PREDICTED: CCR4-NOT transcription complex subunit 10-like [Amphimedon queenslandica]